MEQSEKDRLHDVVSQLDRPAHTLWMRWEETKDRFFQEAYEDIAGVMNRIIRKIERAENPELADPPRWWEPK